MQVCKLTFFVLLPIQYLGITQLLGQNLKYDLELFHNTKSSILRANSILRARCCSREKGKIKQKCFIDAHKYLLYSLQMVKQGQVKNGVPLWPRESEHVSHINYDAKFLLISG